MASAGSRGLTFGQSVILLILTPLLILAILASYTLLGYRAYRSIGKTSGLAFSCRGKYAKSPPMDQELRALLALHEKFLTSSVNDYRCWISDRSDIVGPVACCLPHPFAHQLGCHLWSRNDLSRRLLAGRQNLQMSPTHVDHKNPLSHSSLPVFSHFPLKHCHQLPRSIDAKQRRSFAPPWSVGQTCMRFPTELGAT